MSIQSDALKAKTADRPAEGMSMEKTTPKVGEAPSKSNDEQPVTRNQNFATKGLEFKRVTTGY